MRAPRPAASRVDYVWPLDEAPVLFAAEVRAE
jgi:hypothetical protein